jgi:adenylate cyclase class 2
LEIEAKFRVPNLASLRRRLLDLGASRLGRVRERNWVLDDAAGGLRRKQRLLRLRSHGGKGGVLTVKGPAAGGEFKTREELETPLASLAGFLRQMEMLGFRPAWIYEKRRETWNWRGCAVELDECPEMGFFVEIEGKPGAIRRAAADLGIDPAAHIEDNYFSLWRKHLASRGEPWRDMLFPGSSRPGRGKGRKA